MSLTSVAEIERGAWPVGLTGCYPPDGDHLRSYAEQARTVEGFARYLDEHVLVADR